MSSRTKPIRCNYCGICLLILAALFAVISLDRPPSRSELTTLTGRLESVDPSIAGKSSSTPTRFRIAGDDRLLQYHSKAGELGHVEQELIRSVQRPVRVLVDPADAFATVYEVEIDGRMIQSYDGVAAAWRSDNRLGWCAACALAIAGVVLLLRARWR